MSYRVFRALRNFSSGISAEGELWFSAGDLYIQRPGTEVAYSSQSITGLGISILEERVESNTFEELASIPLEETPWYLIGGYSLNVRMLRYHQRELELLNIIEETREAKAHLALEIAELENSLEARKQ